MKEKILKLRAKGKSYREIEKILGCSKATISYHCGEGQKEKNVARQKRHRNTIRGALHKKLDAFLEAKVRGFRREARGARGKTTSRFNVETAYKKIIQNPVCYLTGRKIDLTNSRSYQLDHKVSLKNGGKNHLTNMGLTSRDANQAKRELSIEEFIKLCIDVCRHNGYTVVQNQELPEKGAEKAFA